MNVLNGTEADTTATQFPADFSWNMCNAAKSEQGSEAHHGWETAKHIGIPTVKSYGRVEGDKDKIGSWATLHIDHAKGIITGHAPAGAGRHEVTFHAENDHGKDERKLTFVVGDKLALTPPMGWNHWYTHYLNITDTIIRNAADEMVKSGMADVGYQYISRTARLCSGPVFRQTRN
jgi:hypothetical protein